MTLEDMKQQLESWAANERIPGKFQAWFTKEALPENCDWRFIVKKIGDSLRSGFCQPDTIRWNPVLLLIGPK